MEIGEEGRYFKGLMEISFEDCVGVFADTVVDACGSSEFEVS